jgi:hypothetical protein
MSLTIQGLLVVLLSIVLPVEEVNAFVDAVMVIVGLLMAWYGRYRIGGITILGTRK